MNTIVVMEGVTTAIVLFIFVCITIPRLVKNRPQFYAAFISVCVIIFLQSLRLMLFNSAGFQVVSGVLIGLLQLLAIIMLFLSAGGLTLREFGSDVANAFEVIRRGEEEKEIIIPTSEMPPKVAAAVVGKRSKPKDEDEHHVETIDMPAGAGWPARGTGAPQVAAPPDQKPSEDKGSIPLE